MLLEVVAGSVASALLMACASFLWRIGRRLDALEIKVQLLLDVVNKDSHNAEN